MTKKQRRRVWGSVTEMRRGKKYVLRWMQNTPQGRRRKTKTVYGTYREACAELDRIHVEHADDAPVPTIAKAYETWLVPKMAAQVEAGTLAPNTRDLVLRSWRNYVGPRWGAMPVDQLRAVERVLTAAPFMKGELFGRRRLSRNWVNIFDGHIDPKASTQIEDREGEIFERSFAMACSRPE